MPDFQVVCHTPKIFQALGGIFRTFIQGWGFNSSTQTILGGGRGSNGYIRSPSTRNTLGKPDNRVTVQAFGAYLECYERN